MDDGWMIIFFLAFAPIMVIMNNRDNGENVRAFCLLPFPRCLYLLATMKMGDNNEYWA